MFFFQERLDAMKRLFPFYSEIWKERGLCWKDKHYERRAVKALRIARRVRRLSSKEASNPLAHL